MVVTESSSSFFFLPKANLFFLEIYKSDSLALNFPGLSCSGGSFHGTSRQ